MVAAVLGIALHCGQVELDSRGPASTTFAGYLDVARRSKGGEREGAVRLVARGGPTD